MKKEKVNLGRVPLWAFEIIKLSVHTGSLRGLGIVVAKDCNGDCCLSAPQGVLNNHATKGLRREFLPSDARLY